MTPPIMPTAHTRRLAAKIVAAAATQGADAARLVRDIHPGQEAALVGALACIAARHLQPAPGRPPATGPVDQAPEHSLIACARCGALMHQPCRTEGGYSRADHPERLTPRRCPCGAPIPKKRGRDYCDDCRATRRRAQQRKALQDHRARRRQENAV